MRSCYADADGFIESRVPFGAFKTKGDLRKNQTGHKLSIQPVDTCTYVDSIKKGACLKFYFYFFAALFIYLILNVNPCELKVIKSMK